MPDSVLLGGDFAWKMLSELQGLKEGERRRILRLHSEKGFLPGDPNILKREQVDRELAEIAGRELRIETTRELTGLPEQFDQIPGFGTLVRESPSFAQYVNGYFSFDVRFAAGRLSNPRPKPNSFWNDRPLALPPPPPCEGVIVSDELIKRFLKQTTPV